MRGAIIPLHNTCSRRNAELRTDRNFSQCSDCLENCAESMPVDRMSNFVSVFVKLQGYAFSKQRLKSVCSL
jgi:hypothetical protein